MRKTILILTICFLVCMPLFVFASNGMTLNIDKSHLSDIPSGYTAIYTKEELNNVRYDLYGNYILMNDIVFTDTDFSENGAFYNKGNGWDPIGNNRSPFQGVFDGNGYAIKNLHITVNTTQEMQIGIFGKNTGTIKNLGAEGLDISVQTTALIKAGGIIGELGTYGSDRGKVINCYVIGNIEVQNNTNSNTVYSYLGGIVGYGRTCNISNCANYSNLTIVGTNSSIYAGGIIGYGECKINRCKNIGIVKAETNKNGNVYSGGIIGEQRGIIAECFNAGDVLAGIKVNGAVSAYAGGISGFTNNNISDCYNTGNIQATSVYTSGNAMSFSGGIAAGVTSSVNNSYNIGEISANYSAGAITAKTFASSVITNCYYQHNGQLNGIGKDGVLDTAVALSEDQLRVSDNFIGFDFVNNWGIIKNGQYAYPQLRFNSHIISSIEPPVVTTTVTPITTPSATTTVTPTTTPSATTTVTPATTPSATTTVTPTTTPSATTTVTPATTPSATITVTPATTPSATITVTPTTTPSATIIVATSQATTTTIDTSPTNNIPTKEETMPHAAVTSTGSASTEDKEADNNLTNTWLAVLVCLIVAICIVVIIKYNKNKNK